MKVYIFSVFIFLQCFVCVALFSQDPIQVKWKWNKAIESYKLRSRELLIEPLIINEVVFFNGALYPYTISKGMVLKYNNPESVSIIKENCKDSILLFDEQ